MRSIATTALFAGLLAFAPVSYTTAAALSPKCTGISKGAECWNELTNRPGCYIFDPYYDPPETATWSGVCVGGVAVGQGTWEWETANNSGESTGMLDDDGKMHGRWVERWADGNVSEGPLCRTARDRATGSVARLTGLPEKAPMSTARGTATGSGARLTGLPTKVPIERGQALSGDFGLIGSD